MARSDTEFDNITGNIKYNTRSQPIICAILDNEQYAIKNRIKNGNPALTSIDTQFQVEPR